MRRTLLVALLLILIVIGYPVNQPAPWPSWAVTSAVAPPYPERFHTCEEVLAAWRAGLISAESLVGGAMWIVDAGGRTVVCPVPPGRRVSCAGTAA